MKGDAYSEEVECCLGSARTSLTGWCMDMGVWKHGEIKKGKSKLFLQPCTGRSACSLEETIISAQHITLTVAATIVTIQEWDPPP
jgi:hypothetical protein